MCPISHRKLWQEVCLLSQSVSGAACIYPPRQSNVRFDVLPAVKTQICVQKISTNHRAVDSDPKKYLISRRGFPSSGCLLSKSFNCVFCVFNSPGEMCCVCIWLYVHSTNARFFGIFHLWASRSSHRFQIPHPASFVDWSIHANMPN